MIDANGKDIEYGDKVRQHPDGEIVAQVYYMDYLKMIVHVMVIDEIDKGTLVKLRPDEIEVI